jgi:hypothetical protein
MYDLQFPGFGLIIYYLLLFALFLSGRAVGSMACWYTLLVRNALVDGALHCEGCLIIVESDPVVCLL